MTSKGLRVAGLGNGWAGLVAGWMVIEGTSAFAGSRGFGWSLRRFLVVSDRNVAGATGSGGGVLAGWNLNEGIVGSGAGMNGSGGLGRYG